MNEGKKSSKGMFGKIESRADALETISNCSWAFLIAVGIAGAWTFFLSKWTNSISSSLLADVALYAILSFILMKWKSRMAAVLLLVCSGFYAVNGAGLATVAIFMNKPGYVIQPAWNIYFVVILLWAGIRAVEATFKLHGKYAEPRTPVMTRIRTHYENLQVTENAAPEVIKGAYRYLSQKWHPDKNPDKRETAERITKIINVAYEVLSDPLQRQEHDDWIREQRAKANDQQDQSPSQDQPSKDPRVAAEADQQTRLRKAQELEARLQNIELRSERLSELRKARTKIRTIGFCLAFVAVFFAFHLFAVTRDSFVEIALSLFGGSVGFVIVEIIRAYTPSQRGLDREESEIRSERDDIR